MVDLSLLVHIKKPTFFLMSQFPKQVEKLYREGGSRGGAVMEVVRFWCDLLFWRRLCALATQFW